MKLASTVIWMLLYSLWGVFAVWLLANNLDQIADGISAQEAIGLFVLVYVIGYSIRTIGNLQDEFQESKKDKG